MLSPINGIMGGSCSSIFTMPTNSPPPVSKKRSAPITASSKFTKRGKSRHTTAESPVTSTGQQSLKGFFKPSATVDSSTASTVEGIEVSRTSLNDDNVDQAFESAAELAKTYPAPDVHMEAIGLDSAIHIPAMVGAQQVTSEPSSANTSPVGVHRAIIQPQENVHDPVETKESWSKLFTKPAAPRCEGHGELCISLLTKKPGMNLGRSFWMCPRPLGPSGAKEKNTQWRCQTFVWCSDWNSIATVGTMKLASNTKYHAS